MIQQLECLKSGTVKDVIQGQSAIVIAAPPERVAAIYRDVETWNQTFPATIEQAHVIRTGANWQEIEVLHRVEGRVPNKLISLSETEIVLEESKSQFNAVFLNQFYPVALCGTHYVITVYISLKGIYKMLKPFVKGYVLRQAHKQINQYVLEPLKRAAEQTSYDEYP